MVEKVSGRREKLHKVCLRAGARTIYSGVVPCRYGRQKLTNMAPQSPISNDDFGIRIYIYTRCFRSIVLSFFPYYQYHDAANHILVFVFESMEKSYVLQYILKSFKLLNIKINSFCQKSSIFSRSSQMPSHSS